MPAYILFLFALLILLLFSIRRRSHGAAYPPGPQGIPVLGNVLELPRSLLFLKLAEWAQVQGPLYTVNILGQPLVIINCAKEAADLLDRSSLITGGRPSLIKASDFLTRGLVIPLIDKGERWRLMRKATHERLNVRDTKSFVQSKKTKLLV
ncbi:hypothetical protein DACRYDRAFT_68234 [Dacryopinax primogenitus]|uniref:Cytochrome P450 n=1 Tax=Dacryopinax primogenitus (strain DJM 731) TaxID=1858805 RepID=M5FWI1_DACPD|nr:uncharacterized protein DACRYDRAFT_68234 [Dacryopinax primogenitus]EJU00729.1 hypothetical protein DACRYDRAFT_68234 [Dacryopinax primogenitus]